MKRGFVPIGLDIGATSIVVCGDIILVVGNIVCLLITWGTNRNGLDEATTDRRVELAPLSGCWPACVSRHIFAASWRCRSADRASI